MKQTLYMSIADKIAEYIKKNKLQPGDKLPTYRELANLFDVSVHTVGSALERLNYKGIVDVRPQSGIFVMEQAWKTLTPNAFNWQSYFHKSKRVPSDLFKRFYEYRSISNKYVLSNVSMASEFGGYDVWKKAMDKTLNKITPEHLFITQPSEFAKFRLAIREYTNGYGLDLSDDCTLLTKDTNYSLLLIALTFFTPGTVCYYIAPSVLDISGFFDMAGVIKMPIPADDEGIDIEYLSQRIKKDGKAFVVVSPELGFSGVRMSMKRRQELYHLCHTNGVPIVELDEYRELASEPLPPIKTLDKHGIVFYVGTFAKMLNNSAEVGWISAAPELIEQLAYMFISMCIGVEMVLHQTLYEMLTDGSFQEYTARTRASMRNREKRLNALLTMYMGDIATWNSEAEVFFWIQFKEHIDVKKVINNNEGLVMSGSLQHICTPPNSIFINLMGINEADLEPAVKQLACLARKSVHIL